ncbi:MAG: ABC transporter ATP-binding protein [Clostridiales bacterium]|uniref:ABC transporter ATP-binding protein n=1 Tax=Zhenhengia sp. TaxID=2944208 RepID=UPI00290C3C5D|nr:ABC transporter ATP-binding protein [Clostridiales bacterium]
MSQHKENAPHRPGGPGPRPMMHHKKEKLKDPKATVKRLLHYLGSSKYIMVFVFFITLLTTVITIIGTKLNGDTVDKFIITRDLNGLAKICLVMLVLYVISSVSVFIQNRAMVRIAQTTTLSIRKDLFRNMQGLPLAYYDSHSSGDLMSRLTNDVDNINMTLAQSVTQLFSGIISIVGMLIAMILLSPVLTLIGLLTTPFMFILMRVVVKRTQPYFIKQQTELGKLNGYIEEMVSGQKAVLLFSQEEKVKEEFGKINSNLTQTAILAQTFSGFMGPMNNCINNITYLIVAVSGGYLMLKGFDITVGIIFSFILYMRNFTRPINEIFNLFNTIQSALAGAERVFEVMDEEKEQDRVGAVDMENIEGEVILEDVHFSYVPEKPILKDATLTAKKGQTIAIVGPTGAGKTTIINLLTKFYDIDSGLITIDGHDIQEVTRESLRKSIAMVLQDTYLFSESVRENIRYGNLDATDEEVEQAAKLANAHSFIKQLPDGYDTILSDNGSNLSQGQRQLLAIARAILMKSSILILDEATSSIDTRTEVAIQRAMEHLMKGKTTFVIAHRLSTIRNADQILALKDGEIIERGTHYELLEKDGFYANLYNSQFKKGIDLDDIIA